MQCPSRIPNRKITPESTTQNTPSNTTQAVLRKAGHATASGSLPAGSFPNPLSAASQSAQKSLASMMCSQLIKLILQVTRGGQLDASESY